MQMIRDAYPLTHLLTGDGGALSNPPRVLIERDTHSAGAGGRETNVRTGDLS